MPKNREKQGKKDEQDYILQIDDLLLNYIKLLDKLKKT